MLEVAAARIAKCDNARARRREFVVVNDLLNCLILTSTYVHLLSPSLQAPTRLVHEVVVRLDPLEPLFQVLEEFCEEDDSTNGRSGCETDGLLGLLLFFASELFA